jgi:hypothetical protein
MVLLDTTVEASARHHRRWGLARIHDPVANLPTASCGHGPPDRYGALWPSVRE